MTDCGCEPTQSDALERKTLVILLVINGAMFLLESILGWIAQSTGLMADSLDMLADALVYGISLFAVGRSDTLKAGAAGASGVIQILLGLGVLAEVMRRSVAGSDPVSALMMAVGAVALLANLACLRLISTHKHDGLHMRAAWIFSINDVIANLGVIAGGGLVLVFSSRIPDLVIGAIISGVVIRGGINILRNQSE